MDEIKENPQSEILSNDLEKVVQESKVQLAQVEQVAVKKRGRPSKAANAGVTNSASTSPVTQPIMPYVPSPMRPALEASFDMISSYANISTNSDKFTLSKEEKEILGMQADMLAMDLMPIGASTKTQKAIALGLTGTMIYGSKYLDFIQSQLKDADKSEKENQINAVSQY